MWLQLILSMLGLGLIDALNPYTIAVLLILLPLVRKKWHGSLFIWGTYLTYVSIAILLYFGVAQLLGAVLGEWLRTHQTIVGVIQLSCAGLSMIGLVWWTIQWYQKVRLASEPPDLARKPTVLSSPWFILGLAIVSTLYDSPSAIPLFWFLGMLTQFAVQTTYAIPLLIVYCFIYIIPMVVLYVLYDRMTGQTFKNFEQRFQMIVRRVTYYSIPLFLLAVSIWMVWDGWARLE
jgi:hypothetical protein